MKRVLRYLKGSVGLKLYINPVQPLILSCYADSSWADDVQDRKSVSGHLITLGEVPVYWRSRKQNHVSTSSCESEYASLSDLISELIWHKQMMKELDVPQSGPTVVNEDNQACIQLSQSEKTQGRSKHIHIRYHNVRDAVQSGETTLQYTPSDQNFADILTKSLARVKFVRGVEMLNLK